MIKSFQKKKRKVEHCDHIPYVAASSTHENITSAMNCTGNQKQKTDVGKAGVFKFL